jgi:hypothetical protein
MTTLTDRYVTATLSRLPQARRADIERELRASIADAVDDRMAAGEEARAAEFAALSDLGDPARLAAGYADRPQYLVGPAYYLDYVRLLTTLGVIVLPIVAGAVILAHIINRTALGAAIGTTIGATITTGVHLFFWVTFVFVAMERGTLRNPLPSQPWTPDALPVGPPSKRARFGELIAATVATVLFVTALLISQQISPARDAAGEPISVIDPWLWDTGAIYVFVALVLAGLTTRYLRFYKRWQLPWAITSLLIDLTGAAALIWAGASAHLVNPAFATAVGWPPDAVEWTHRGMMIAGAAVVFTSFADAFTRYRSRGLETAGV